MEDKMEEQIRPTRKHWLSFLNHHAGYWVIKLLHRDNESGRDVLLHRDNVRGRDVLLHYYYYY